MTALSKLRRRTVEPAPVEGGLPLGASLSFLDVIQETCSHSGRYTLVAEADGITYTVMIDRGGPFNVAGGGLTGSEALKAAAALRRGTYIKADGWPVDQPLYQLGLDETLQGIALGTRPEARQLPPARGVNALRDGGRATPGGGFALATHPAESSLNPAASWLVAEAPAPIETATPYEAALLPDPAPKNGPSNGNSNGHSNRRANGHAGEAFPMTPWVTAQAAPVTTREAEAATEGIAEAPAEPFRDVFIPEPAPLAPEVEAEPAPAVAAYGVEDTGWLREAAISASVDVDPTAPTAASKRQGPIRRGITRFLLWTVQVDNEGQTLGQALGLVGRALGSAFAMLVGPIDREIIRRWHRARDDWRRSGEAVAKQKRRDAGKQSPKTR